MFQGVDRPNTTLIGQDRKFKDLRALLYTSFKDLPFLYEIKGGGGGGGSLKISLSKIGFV